MWRGEERITPKQYLSYLLLVTALAPNSYSKWQMAFISLPCLEKLSSIPPSLITWAYDSVCFLAFCILSLSLQTILSTSSVFFSRDYILEKCIKTRIPLWKKQHLQHNILNKLNHNADSFFVGLFVHKYGLVFLLWVFLLFSFSCFHSSENRRERGKRLSMLQIYTLKTCTFTVLWTFRLKASLLVWNKQQL